MPPRRAAWYALAAGVLLILAHARAGTLLLDIGRDLALRLVPPSEADGVRLLFAALFFLAGLGGVAVLLGGALYWKRWMRAGTLFVTLGAGIGVLGLVLLLAVSLVSGEIAGLVGWLLGPAGVGVVLSILARRAAR